jgi:Secretion system C-terminal sorting domain
MKIALTLFAVVCCSFLNKLQAQITINSTDMPFVDTIYQFHAASTSNVDFSLTGADVVWDYTGLINTGFTQDSFVNPSSTPWVYQLVFNNFLFPSYDATHAQPGSGIVLPSQIPFEVTNVSNFYKNSSTSFKMIGFGATINGLPTPIQYQGSDRWYKFPLTYGNLDTSSYSFEINVPSLGYWKQAGTRINDADGFGTLMLPNGQTYEVIRLKSRTEIVDSLHIDALGFTIPIPRIRTEYKFLASGETEPVLQITTQPLLLVFGPETVIGVRYKNEMNLASFESPLNSTLSVYPNPAEDFLTISNPQGSSWRRVALINGSGQVLYKNDLGGNENIKVDVSALPGGSYYLIVDFENGSAMAKKVIVK